MPASVLTTREAKRAAAMYALGYSVPQVARKLGRSRKAVSTGLRHVGVKQRTPTEGLRLWHRQFTNPDNWSLQ